MGMFDWVRCAYPLPTPEAQDYQFQTKDTPCLLEEYTITAAGRLICHEWDYERTPDAELPIPTIPWVGCMRRVAGSERRIDMEWDGPFTFYGTRQTGEMHAYRLDTGEDTLHPGPPPPWYEFVATFVDGQVQTVVQVVE